MASHRFRLPRLGLLLLRALGLLSLLPLLALIAGLVLIQSEHVRRQVAAVAEVDADLLLDDLPPSAYSDPGFVEFLKHPPE